MGAGTVAVFTGELDVTADAVIIELQRRGVPVFRCDPAAFPAASTLKARFADGCWSGHLALERRTLDLVDVGCAWWRRPTPITIADDVLDGEWVRREAVAGLRGVLSTLPWLNHPDDIHAAERKPLQLALAASAGLTVPPTLITNDPGEARLFAAKYGPVLYKPISGGALDGERLIYASVIDEGSLDASVAVTAHLFQQQVAKVFDVRVTVVDGQVFAARIDALGRAGRTDWRADYSNLRYSPYALPDEVAQKVRVLLDRLRLRFGALDFVVTSQGEHVFLEVNPNGQWAWIEDETGLPIAAAIADALQKGRP
ncbi:ATP-grasp ribosomal peptide maturase [Actinoplanes sp. CA-054009]